MAWPNTALTTYVASTTPAIKAFDLNAFQTGINGIINGTYSIDGLILDGTGGNVVTPIPGALKVTRNPVNTATVLQLGEVNIGQMVSGSAYVSSGGTLLRQVNVQGIAHPTTGKYVITWNISLDTSTSGEFFFMGGVVNTAANAVITYNPLNTNPSQLEVYTTVNGVITNAAFSVSVIGA